MPVSGSAREIVRRNNQDEKQRHRLIENLLSGSNKDGVPGKHDVNNAAKTFACSRYQILRVWNPYKQQKADGADIDLRNRRYQNSGRKGIDTAKTLEIIESVPLKNRTTQRALAKEVGLTQGLQQNLKKLGLRAASRLLKPLLTEAGKLKRLDWAGSPMHGRGMVVPAGSTPWTTSS